MTRDIWSKEKILKKIIAIYYSHGELMLAKKNVKNDLYTAARRHFGSWSAAINDAGLDYGKIRLTNKYNLNDNFFDVDTPESFYWAGFIMADGDMANNHRRLKIGLAKKDTGHVEKFKQAVDYTGIIEQIEQFDKRTEKIYYRSRVRIGSAYLCDTLEKKFDIFPAKSLICKFPDRIADHSLVHHFIRGYLDGDGCWHFVRTQPNRLKLNVVGTKEFLEILRHIFHINCETSDNLKITYRSGIYSLLYTGVCDAVNIRNFVYSGSNKNIYLQRKYNVAFGEWENKWMSDLKKDKSWFIGGKIIRPIVCKNLLSGDIIFLNKICEGSKYGLDRHYIQKCCAGKRKSYKGCSFKYATEKDIKNYYKGGRK